MWMVKRSESSPANALPSWGLISDNPRRSPRRLRTYQLVKTIQAQAVFPCFTRRDGCSSYQWMSLVNACSMYTVSNSYTWVSGAAMPATSFIDDVLRTAVLDGHTPKPPRPEPVASILSEVLSGQKKDESGARALLAGTSAMRAKVCRRKAGQPWPRSAPYAVRLKNLAPEIDRGPLAQMRVPPRQRPTASITRCAMPITTRTTADRQRHGFSPVRIEAPRSLRPGPARQIAGRCVPSRGRGCSRVAPPQRGLITARPQPQR